MTVKEGDLVIGGVGAPYDMIQRGVDGAIILEVIYHMELGDCAFVKRSDGSWTFAFFQEIYWRGVENDRGPFGAEAVATFTVDEPTMKERHIPERR